MKNEERPVTRRMWQLNIFLQELYEFDPKSSIKTSEIYEEYSRWCRKHGIVKQSMKNFGNQLNGVGVRVNGPDRLGIRSGLRKKEN